MSISLLRVFYSEQRHYKTYGYATNWNSTGYWEIHYLVRKYSVNVFSMNARNHKETQQLTIKILFINTRCCRDNEKYWKCHWSMQKNRIKFSWSFQYFKYSSFNIKFNKIQILKTIVSGRPHKGCWFCEGMETFLSSTTVISIYYRVEQNIECKKGNVYNREDRSWMRV